MSLTCGGSLFFCAFAFVGFLVLAFVFIYDVASKRFSFLSKSLFCLFFSPGEQKKERGKEECDKCGKNMYQPLYVRSAFDDDFDDDNNNNKACGRSPLFFVRAREEGGEEERDSTQKKVRCRTHTMIPKKKGKRKKKISLFYVII